MFVPRIWGSDRRDPEMRAALNANWRRRELWWERLQEKANADLETGRRRLAYRRFRWAYWIARLGFDGRDPRYATSLANIGFVARERGQHERADHLYRRAADAWTQLPGTLAVIEMKPRARSSLFHLRMEQKHRGLYQARIRSILAARVAETGSALVALADNSGVEARLYQRWKAEKPQVFDETRRLLAACLLVAAGA